MTDEPRVLLVCMPFCTLTTPSISISVLQAKLRADGIHCDTFHPSFMLANRIAPADIEQIGSFGPKIGDWLFVPALYGGPIVPDEISRYEALLQWWFTWEPESTDKLLDWRQACSEFLDECADAVDWDSYDVVGFTSMFEQNIAALALARRVKERNPRSRILFGGANWRGEMGVALHETFPFVDVACTGEADLVITELVRRAHRRDDLSAIPGIVYRDGDASVDTGPAPLVHDMDALPLPDYSDWLADRAACPAVADDPWKILFESSRGCWWGQRSHCTFCGLNGEGMVYRLKSPDRMLAEMRELRARHPGTAFMATDTILDMRYFHTLLPALADDGPWDVFYETKANLTFDQVRRLANAGIRQIQPGIEHLSDHVLESMAKGTTLIQNVQLLKWCEEFGITAHWNFLIGFPAERREDYTEIREIIEAIRWLEAPGTFQQVVIQRFSPFHTDPEALGFTGVRHDPVYEFLYPGDDAMLDRIAYNFVGEYAWEHREADTHAAVIGEEVRTWVDDGDPGGVYMNIDADGALFLLDDRRSSGRSRHWQFTGWRATALRVLERGHTLEELVGVSDLGGVDRAQLGRFLDWCCRERLMIEYHGRYLVLAVHVPAREQRTNGAARFARRIPVHAAVG